MKGDYSRITFDPKKHYSGILMQQGRVQTDADFNEQFDLTRHCMETEVQDFIGQSGVPEKNSGFSLRGEADKLLIGAGRCYVEGMLIENDSEVSYTEQDDLPGQTLPDEDGLYLVYLDVWRRHLTSLEEPVLRDAALGNQDTAARIKNLWQTKMIKLGDKELTLNVEQKSRFKPGKGWNPSIETKNPNDLPLSTGCLKAQVTGGGSTLGNQLYRVEIHTPGAAGTATFKWSRDNASLAAEVTAITDETITIRYIGCGTEYGFKSGDTLEVTNDEIELQGQPGILVQVDQVDDVSLRLTIEEADRDAWYKKIVGASSAADLKRLRKLHTRVRQWNSSGTLPVPTDSTKWEKVENDLEIQFTVNLDPAGSAHYKTGDYWLIPSRSLMKDIYWEQDADGNPLALTSYGIDHFYTCLGLVVCDNKTWSLQEDLRVPFKNLIGGLLSKEGDTVTGNFGIEGTLQLAEGEAIRGFSNDEKLSANSDELVPTQKAIKTYIDDQVVKSSSNKDLEDFIGFSL